MRSRSVSFKLGVGPVIDHETLVISTWKTFKLHNIPFFPCSRLKTEFCNARRPAFWEDGEGTGLHPAPQPRITCPQGAVGPVEKEHRIAAQPPQRRIRRSPDVMEVAFLAVIIEQGLRERRSLFTRANASPRDGRRPRRPSRTGPIWPLALLPQAPPPPPAARRPPTRQPRPLRSPTPAEKPGARRRPAAAPTWCTSASIVATQRRGGASGRARESLAARCHWLASRGAHCHWLGGKGGGRDRGRKTCGKRRNVPGGPLGSREMGAGPPGGEVAYHWVGGGGGGV